MYFCHHFLNRVWKSIYVNAPSYYEGDAVSSGGVKKLKLFSIHSLKMEHDNNHNNKFLHIYHCNCS
jgi:hypothetical protein